VLKASLKHLTALLSRELRRTIATVTSAGTYQLGGNNYAKQPLEVGMDITLLKLSIHNSI